MFNQPQDRSMFLNSVSSAETSPQAADAGGPQSQVHAGAGTEPLTSEVLFRPHNWRAYETVHRLVREANAMIWDRAVELANAEPSVPFISDTPWREPDHDYRKRLADKHPHNDHSTLDSYGLDAVGKGYGLLRSRLVQTLERARG